MITGVVNQPTHPPKIARQLKAQIEDLFHRYTFDEVMAEIARQRPAFDIHVTAAQGKKR